MRLRHIVTLLAVLLIALPVAAQEQQGSISGVVRDAQGAPIAGASIVAKSASGLTFETTTDQTGTYRFPSVPPGRYDVTAKLSGFSPAKGEASVVLGSTATVTLSLKVGGVTETIEVTAESPLIDSKSSSRSTNLREEQIDKMPKGRDYTSLISQAPGVNAEYKLGGISIDGSSGSENRYIVDGAEITNIQTGTAARAQSRFSTAQNMMLPTDFLDEVQIKSSGYSAEFGGSTGGVVNAITKTGTNSWRGDVMMYYSGDKLNGDERPNLRLKPTNSREAEYVTYGKDKYNRFEPGFTIGGPLMRDKVWFFGGYNPTFRPLDRSVVFASDGVARTTSQDFTAHYAVGNVTAQINDKTRAKLAFRLAPSTEDGVLAALNGSSSPSANYGITTKRPTYSGGISLDYTPSNHFYTSLRGAYYFSDSTTEGVFQGTRYSFASSNIGQAGVPANLQQVTGFSNVPTNTQSQFDKQKRLALQWDATFFAHAGGEHQVKFGVQLDRIQNQVLNGETGNLVTIRWNLPLAGDRGQFGYYSVRSNGVKPDLGFITEGDVSVNNLGLFVQDAWTINNRFTLNLGLRTEDESVPNFDPQLSKYAFKYGFGDKLAPRVGLAWDIKGDGKTKAYASWGIFYDITKLELPRGSFGGDKWLEYYYSLDTADWPNLDRAGCPPACPGRLLRGPIDFRFPSTAANGGIDPDIKPMRSQERSAGVERQLTNVLSVGVRYVHKQFDRVVEDIGALDAQQNEIYTIGNPGEGLTETAFVLNGQKILLPKAKRNYDAAELTLHKRMSNRWSGHFSYLWSRLFGNHTGLSQGDENGRVSPNVGRNYDVTYMMFDQTGKATFGVLPTDRTHQLKAQFVYDASFGTSFGLNWFGASGVPKTRELAAIPPNNYPVQYLGRGSDGRMPFLHQLDLNVQHEFKLTNKVRMTLMANVLNLLDGKTATNYFATQQQGSGLVITEQQFYAGQVNFPQAFTQQNLVTDPRFLQDGYCSVGTDIVGGCGYQDPRQLRLGVKLSF